MVNCQTSQYELLNLFGYFSRLGIFQNVRDILQFTVSLDHPVPTFLSTLVKVVTVVTVETVVSVLTEVTIVVVVKVVRKKITRKKRKKYNIIFFNLLFGMKK